MASRKIGTISLCGMMIGAVLGSGIIILPPLAIELAGQWALPAWALTAVFGIAFSYVFAHIGTLFPGAGGAASAVEHAFSPSAKRFAAYTLSCAALFGPAAVMLTIIDYLPPVLLPATSFGRCAAAAAVLGVCACLQLSGLKNMSRVTLVLSSLATGLLLAGSSLVLAFDSAAPAPLPPFDGARMGEALLLLFWAVVGWEVVGNFGAEVKDPRRTVPRAALIAALVIGLVDVAVAAGLQCGVFPPGAGRGVTVLLLPLFGAAAPWVMCGLTTALCVTTYLMFVGGVVRLVAFLADEGSLPAFLGRRNTVGAPVYVILLYTAVHVAQIALKGLGILDVAKLVAIADGFFMANSLLGTMAAVRLLHGPLARIVAAALSAGVGIVLLQSSWAVLAAIAAMAALTMTPVRSLLALMRRRLPQG